MSTRQIPASQVTVVDVKDSPRRASDKHLESRLELLRDRRPRRRGMGRRPGHQDPGRQSRAGRRRDPPPRHDLRLLRQGTRRRRRLRRLPHRQETIPGLRHRARRRLADRHRDNRGRMPPHRQRQNGHHRSQMGPRRSRSHPQAPRHPQQRRLRSLLDLAPGARTAARPLLALQRPRHPRRIIKNTRHDTRSGTSTRATPKSNAQACLAQ
jgi:hypothetical protein